MRKVAGPGPKQRLKRNLPRGLGSFPKPRSYSTSSKSPDPQVRARSLLLVEGKMMREEFPLVTDWCERLHDLGGTLSTFVKSSSGTVISCGRDATGSGGGGGGGGSPSRPRSRVLKDVQEGRVDLAVKIMVPFWVP